MKTVITSDLPGRKAIAIAGVRGGMGKTVVTIGLIRALRRRGYAVSPFKKGPDYIDPAWLSLAAGRNCYNLDTFLMNDETTRNVFLENSKDADLSILEGNRGLYDGYDVLGTHSFAELAKLLNVPVVLVVDCTKASRTIAAIVLGVKMLDQDLRLSGVILNNVAGERHRALITEAVEKYAGLPVFGSIPRIPALRAQERHLGLVPVYEHGGPLELVDELGDIIERVIDLDAIVALSGAEMASGQGVKPDIATDAFSPFLLNEIKPYLSERPRIGVMRDSAFNFYYRENIEALVRAGAEIIPISPLNGGIFPDVDALYIGGGFPETHASRIASNTDFNSSLRESINAGLPVYAECGGLIYLSSSILIDGEHFPMSGVFPMIFEIAHSPQGHGYTVLCVDGDNPFYPTGAVVNGHEFRYARIVNKEDLTGLKTVFAMKRGTGIIDNRDGAVYRNTIATFCHTHALSENVTWPAELVKMASARIKRYL